MSIIEMNTDSAISILPNEDLLGIFQFLSTEELGRISSVCNNWKELALSVYSISNDELKERFPKLSIIDTSVWKTHLNKEKTDTKPNLWRKFTNVFSSERPEMDLNVEYPLDKRKIIPEIMHAFTSLKLENEEAGITLLTIPKGFSWSEVKKRLPDNGNISRILDCIPTDCENTITFKTHRIAITNSILKGTTNLSIIKQQLVNEKGYELPTVNAAGLLAILTSMNCFPSQDQQFCDKTYQVFIGSVTLKLGPPKVCFSSKYFEYGAMKRLI